MLISALLIAYSVLCGFCSPRGLATILLEVPEALCKVRRGHYLCRDLYGGKGRTS